MSRARILKPSIFKNEILGTSDPLLTLLFQGLWCLADCNGVLEDRPLKIKAEIFPYREIPDLNIFLNELEISGFVKRYHHAGTALIEVVNFIEHQHPHPKEKSSQHPVFIEADQLPCLNTEINGKFLFKTSLPSYPSYPSYPSLPSLPSLPPETGEVVFSEKKEVQASPQKPISEIVTWLDAVASACGAKDRRTLSPKKRWSDVCETAIREDRSLVDMLDAIKSERNRLGSDVQFFTPESILKRLQMSASGSLKQNNFPKLPERRAPRGPTGTEQAAQFMAEMEAERQRDLASKAT